MILILAVLRLAKRMGIAKELLQITIFCSQSDATHPTSGLFVDNENLLLTPDQYKSLHFCRSPVQGILPYRALGLNPGRKRKSPVQLAGAC